jgi:hypothetical protein
MTILFLHGWQSVPGGVKPTYLTDHGHQVINPKLPDDDFVEAVRIAQAEFDKYRPQVVVGSSRGGAVAVNMNSGEAKLVLLCPAWRKYGTAKTVKAGTVILHSRADDVVPFADSEELVNNSGLAASALIEVGSDHRLAAPESLEVMLRACEVEDDEEDWDDILEQDWTGLCYTGALRWLRQADEGQWLVVHGTVLSERAGKRVEHAWCERGEWVVLDLAMPVGARFIERKQYYRVMKPEVKKAYSADEALLLSIKHRHDGPWDETEQLFMKARPMRHEEPSWEQLFRSFIAGRKSRPPKVTAQYVAQARRRLAANTDADWDVLAAALNDDDRKWFVARIFAKAPVPERLFQPFIRAAISEPNPSLNRNFVEPCIAAFGHRRVNEALLDMVQHGTDFEIAGAVAALYWANMAVRYVGDVPKYTLDHATPESRRAYLQLQDVWQRRRSLFLRTFVTNDAVQVRREIIPQLELDEHLYPDELKPMVAQAIDIARHHPDDYIRHRVEVQLGNEKLLKPLPPRDGE